MEISQIHNPWRDKLRPASFRGVMFFVEIGQKAGGRRDVIFEFPKRDKPYAEDMGRHAYHFIVTAYVIGPNYLLQRDALEDALDTYGPGILQLPSRGPQKVVVDGMYRSTERRELGGFCEFEIPFTEAGDQPVTAPSTVATVNARSSDLATIVAAAVDAIGNASVPIVLRQE